MKVPWEIGLCIVCNRAGPLSEEHLIPRALGGILTCRFLCRDCNSGFGKDVEAFAKSDPSIRLAANQLREYIPDLAKQLLKSHPYVTTGPGPRVPGYVQNGQFRAKEQKLDDGSLILPTDKASGAITKMLKREGHGESLITRVVHDLEGVPENRRKNIAPGLEIINWHAEGVELDLSQSKPLDDLILVKIAFEFLALCVGKKIYTNEGPLYDLRRILMKGRGLDNELLRVERFSSGGYRPFHGICIEDNLKHFQLQIRLFGRLAYHVHFPKLRVVPPRCAYTHWLGSNKENMKVIGLEPTATAS